MFLRYFACIVKKKILRKVFDNVMFFSLFWTTVFSQIENVLIQWIELFPQQESKDHREWQQIELQHVGEVKHLYSFFQKPVSTYSYRSLVTFGGCKEDLMLVVLASNEGPDFSISPKKAKTQRMLFSMSIPKVWG